MANLSGPAQAFHSDTSIIDTSNQFILGMRSWDSAGNEYVYLQGTASTVAGDWIVYDKDFGTTRLVPDEVGPVGIAMAAVVADNFGWYQNFGINTIAKTDTIAANSSLYIDGTVGRVDDAGVSGDLVIGAYSMTADTSNVATVSINYPSVSNEVGSVITTALIQLKAFADDVAASTGSDKIVWWIPVELDGYNLVDAEAFVSSTSETTTTIVIRNVGSATNFLSTPLSIKAEDFDSVTTGTAKVINTSADDIHRGTRIAIDLTGTTGTAQGLGVHMSFELP